MRRCTCLTKVCGMFPCRPPPQTRSRLQGRWRGSPPLHKPVQKNYVNSTSI